MPFQDSGPQFDGHKIIQDDLTAETHKVRHHVPLLSVGKDGPLRWRRRTADRTGHDLAAPPPNRRARARTVGEELARASRKMLVDLTGHEARGALRPRQQPGGTDAGTGANLADDGVPMTSGEGS
jgi:hypothetical protein